MRRSLKLPLDALRDFLLEPEGFDPGPRRSPEIAPTKLDWAAVFGNDRPVEIEVGFGKGLFLVTEGSGRPDTNFLGIEIERKYALYVANRVAKRELKNVRVLCGDARIFFERTVPAESVHGLHIFFPDPWWKKRHRKRRLFTAEFVKACARVLKPNGQLHVVTDVAEYFEEIQGLLSGQESLVSLSVKLPEEPRHDFDYLTNFERKYRREGRPIYRTLLAKAPLSRDAL